MTMLSRGTTYFYDSLTMHGAKFLSLLTLLTASLFFIPTLLFSQTKAEVTGTVLDGYTREPLIGVSIREKGTTNGTVTNIEGAYRLTLENSASSSILTFRYAGYLEQDVEVEGRDVVDVLLLISEASGEEIVVVGFGVENKKVSTAAVSLVTSKEISRTVNTRVEQAIQGKASGIVVSQNSGSPGAKLNVRVRGTGTPNNSDPVYIIDGIRAGNIEFLNPDDVERIDILKDAASAAIYGVAAANGIVLISTKKGDRGSDEKDYFKVSYSGYGGFQQLQKRVDLLDAYQYNELYEFGDPYYSTDWQKAVIGNAPITNHHLSFTGGSKNTNYVVSGGYYNQYGIIGAPIQPEKSKYERFTFKTSVQSLLYENLEVKADVNFSVFNRRSLPENNEIISVTSRLLNFSPAAPIYYANGKPYYDTLVASDLRNPVSTILTEEGLWTQLQTFDNVSVSYNFFDRLKLQATYNVDYALAKEKSFSPKYEFAPQDRRSSNSLTETRHEWFNWTLQGTLSYKEVFAKVHDVSALAGFELHERNFEKLSASNTGLETNIFEEANLGLATGGKEARDASGEKTSRSLLSFFGRVSYKYDNKYILTSNFRADGSSRFGPKNRFAYFPSVSVAWVLSEEEFYKKSLLRPVINSAKLRFSWGVNGNDNIGDYGFYSQIKIGSNYILGEDESTSSGATIEKVPNRELRWEISTQYDVGLELGFFEDRFRLTLDYYYKLTSDVLVEVPIPGHIGLTASEVNAGNVVNEGFEVEMSYADIVDDFSWRINFSIAYLHNEMVALGSGGEPIFAGNNYHIGDQVSKTEVGYPIASFFGYKVKGIFQNKFEVEEYENLEKEGDDKRIQPSAKPGDFIYEDVNNDGEITNDDKVYLGKPQPDVVLGLSATFEYAGFDLFFLLQAFIGNSVYRGYTGFKWGAVNTLAPTIENRWRDEGNSSKYPATAPLIKGEGAEISVYTPETLKNSSFFVEDASFLKLRNIQLGYTIPPSVIGFVESIRVYMAVQNVFTITPYSGFDPEIGKVSEDDPNVGQLEQGIDKGFYPAARSFIFGLQIVF